MRKRGSKMAPKGRKRSRKKMTKIKHLQSATPGEHIDSELLRE